MFIVRPKPVFGKMPTQLEYKEIFIERPQAIIYRLMHSKNLFSSYTASTISRKIVIVPKKQEISLEVPVLKAVKEPFYEKKTLIIDKPAINPNAKYQKKHCFCSPKATKTPNDQSQVGPKP